jgi:cytochrome P450/NADPH-cytochrome P450 reductase
MLPPMRARQYSISSSPLWQESHCTLTLAVVDAPSWSGQGRYIGVASHYLAEALPGTKVSVSTRPSNAAFHLPESLETPIIMICAGTGLAPFHGFIQERAIQAANGRTLGEALLFFGCDHPDVDFLYRDELLAWEKAGVVKVRPAFSKAPAGQVSYVQHRLWQDRAEVIALINQNARIFVCGDGRRMAPGVRETFTRIYQEAAQCSPEQAEHWMNELERTSSRYVTDVFS